MNGGEYSEEEDDYDIGDRELQWGRSQDPNILVINNIRRDDACTTHDHG
jgi:hypothetical protein